MARRSPQHRPRVDRLQPDFGRRPGSPERLWIRVKWAGRSPRQPTFNRRIACERKNSAGKMQPCLTACEATGKPHNLGEHRLVKMSGLQIAVFRRRTWLCEATPMDGQTLPMLDRIRGGQRGSPNAGIRFLPHLAKLLLRDACFIRLIDAAHSSRSGVWLTPCCLDRLCAQRDGRSAASGRPPISVTRQATDGCEQTRSRHVHHRRPG